MLTKVVDGKTIELSADEETNVRAGWAQANIDNLAKAIVIAKREQKELLIRQKVESLLVVEFAAIDAAKTKDEIKAVKLK